KAREEANLEMDAFAEFRISEGLDWVKANAKRREKMIKSGVKDFFKPEGDFTEKERRKSGYETETEQKLKIAMQGANTLIAIGKLEMNMVQWGTVQDGTPKAISSQQKKLDSSKMTFTKPTTTDKDLGTKYDQLQQNFITAQKSPDPDPDVQYTKLY